jgi:hypothetical protein
LNPVVGNQNGLALRLSGESLGKTPESGGDIKRGKMILAWENERRGKAAPTRAPQRRAWLDLLIAFFKIGDVGK